jgi:hypothetical protein
MGEGERALLLVSTAFCELSDNGIRFRSSLSIQLRPHKAATENKSRTQKGAAFIKNLGKTYSLRRRNARLRKPRPRRTAVMPASGT